MAVQVTTHLNFRGRAREALDFYAAAFGGERTIVTYGDLGAAPDGSEADRVMWGQVVAPGGFRIMAYDVQPDLPWEPGLNPFYVALRGTEAPEIGHTGRSFAKARRSSRSSDRHRGRPFMASSPTGSERPGSWTSRTTAARPDRERLAPPPSPERDGGRMKFAAIIEYGGDKDGLKAAHAAHRTYLREFLENGQLRAAGPFAEDAGALWVLDADSADEAERIVKGDPLVSAGVITSWRIRPISYWSAQEAKGAR